MLSILSVTSVTDQRTALVDGHSFLTERWFETQILLLLDKASSLQRTEISIGVGIVHVEERFWIEVIFVHVISLLPNLF